MDKAELYCTNHGESKRDAIQMLMQFKPKMKIYDDHKILDIGCGPGDTTVDHLLPLVPSSGLMVGVDSSPAMIQYANAKYRDPRLKFEVMDIGNPNFSEKYKCTFNTVFSFYCLHWVQNQYIAMKNIIDVLQNGGEAMLLFLVDYPVFRLYEKLFVSRKWRQYMLNYREAISPYYYSSDPEADVRRLLTDIGFIINECVCAPKSYTYPCEEMFMSLLEAVNPFVGQIPNNMVNDYLNDCKNLLLNLDLISISKKTGEVTVKYSLLTIHIMKPKFT